MTTDTAAPPGRTTYAEVFAIREFRVLYGGNVATVLAETMSMLALSVLVFQATRSPFWSAVAFTAGFLPQAVGGALLLSLADRLPPRAAIVVGNLVRVAVCLVIAATALPVAGALAVVLAAAASAPSSVRPPRPCCPRCWTATATCSVGPRSRSPCRLRRSRASAVAARCSRWSARAA